MRILIITRNFPPDRGGIQRLVHRMALELAQEFTVAVIAPRGSAKILPPAMTANEVPTTPLWRFFIAALAQSLIVARRFRPDVVLAGSGLTAPFAWLSARLARARMGIYVHGLDLVVRHPIYRWFWLPFIRRADVCITNSQYTARLAVAIGIHESRITIIHPGVDLPESGPATTDFKECFKERFSLGNGPVLLSVGRLIARKGLLEFVENSLPEIAAKYPDVRLVVLGDEEPDLLHGDSSGLGARVRLRAGELGVSRNLKFIGPQDDATLAAAYRTADVHVFPVREIEGDVEGFGMVAVEAAAHGLPTVAFDVGGVADAIEDGVSGYLIEASDYDRFSTRIIALLGKKEPDLRCRAIEFARQFEWRAFGEKIVDLLQMTTRRKTS